MDSSARRTAFVGGKVWTPGYAAPRRLDVLVEGRHVAAVARSGELEHDAAEVVDLAGRLLVPGFQDAHAHPLTGGANLLGCDLAGVTTVDGMLERVATYAATLPRGRLGDGWGLGSRGLSPVRAHPRAVGPGDGRAPLAPAVLRLPRCVGQLRGPADRRRRR